MFSLLYSIFLATSLFLKRNRAVYFSLLIFLWICFGWSGKNADTGIYLDRYRYYKDESSRTEFLFTWFLKISHYFHVDYKVFLIVVSLICIILLYLFVRKLPVKYTLLPFAFFLVYPFMMSVVIVRFTLASSFIIYAFSYLFCKNSYWWIKYIVFVLIASLIHSSCIFFIVLLLMRKLSFKKLLSVTVLLFIVFLFVSNLLQYIIGSNLDFFSEKMAGVNKEVEELNKSSFNFYFGAISRMTIIVATYIFIYKKYYNKEKYPPNEIDIIDKTFKINILSLSSIGLYFISVDFFRLSFPLLFLNYSIYAIIIRRSRKKAILISLVLISCIIELYLLLLRYDTMVEIVFSPFFNNNRLFP